VVWLRSPRVDLYRFFQCYHKEFDALVFDNFEVNSALQIANVDPSIAPLHLLLEKEIRKLDFLKTVSDRFNTNLTSAVSSKDLGLEPREIVDSDSVLLSRNCDQNVLALEHFHLLEPTARNELVDFTLTTSVQEHQSIFCSNKQVHAYKNNPD